MNRKWKKGKSSPPKSKESPPMFDDEVMEIPKTSGGATVNVITPVTPETKIITSHSTPLHNSIKRKSTEYTEINYIESPIEPLTQNPPNEVGWDYQRPILKEEQNSSFEINKTPKRSHLLSKKRNSNSPLLYKPLKKKLIEEEEKQSMHTLKSELLALHKKESSKKSKEQCSEVSGETQLVIELDSQPSEDSDIYLQVTTNTDESPGQKIETINKNYRALLDDSAEEDAMIICSQKVEEKENSSGKVSKSGTSHYVNAPSTSVQNINSKETKSNLDVKQTSNLNLKDIFKNPSKEIDDSMEDLLVICSQKVEEKVLGTKQVQSATSSRMNKYQNKSVEITVNVKARDGFKKPTEETITQSKGSEKVLDESKDSCSSKCESNSLEIPDDSFDEIFGELDEDFCKSDKTKVIEKSVLNKSVKSFDNLSIKTVSLPHTTATVKTVSKVTVQNASKNTYYCLNSKESNPTVQTKIINAKANFGYLNKDYVPKNLSSKCEEESANVTTNEVRTFKAKSFSDSNFHNQNTSVNKYDQSESNLNSMRDLSKQLGSTSTKKTSVSDQNINLPKDNFRRTNSTSSISTPAEIERKRQEALMKREANMKKRLQNSAMQKNAHSSIRK